MGGGPPTDGGLLLMPSGVYPRPPPSPEAVKKRFWDKVDKNGPVHPTLGRCWIWTAGISRGYGYFSLNDKWQRAHRVSYQLSGKTIPVGREIDHRCRNKLCVNPQHLRLATRKQNNEHLGGAQKNNRSSGVRGVYPRTNGRWVAKLIHNRTRVYCGDFDTIAEAEAAVIAKRNELFTHNDADKEN